MPDEHQSSRPGRSFTVGGWRPTGRFRIRSALFCFPIVEELREPSSLGRAWLIFLGPDGQTRRLAPAPHNWRRLQAPELYALAQAATPFKSGAAS